MNTKYLLFFFFLISSLCAHAGSDFKSQYKNNFFLSCTKEMSSGGDEMPLDLAASICSCTATSLVNANSVEKLKSIENDIAANYKIIQSYTERCSEIEIPKYFEQNPDFLETYIQQHPEMFQ